MTIETITRKYERQLAIILQYQKQVEKLNLKIAYFKDKYGKYDPLNDLKDTKPLGSSVEPLGKK